MSVSSTQVVFDHTAATYNHDRAKLIPSHDAFYGWAIRLIPDGAQEIVDLGAGTGLLSTFIRSRFPEAHIHLVDFSGLMLDQARALFKDDPNVSFHQIDYTRQSLPQTDAVVSALSIHHSTDDDKQRVFASVHDALRPGARFINADQVAGPTHELTDSYNELWLKQIRANGATEEQIAASLYRRRDDKCSPVETQLQWMRVAGFHDADCWYKEGSFAVLAGSRE